MKAIILAAGYATRLYPLTKDTPKALLPVAGKPIIDYIVDEFSTIPEIDDIIAVSNHKFAGCFYEWKNNSKFSRKITVIDDGTETEEGRLGAIGDINFTLNRLNIDEDICVIAGDNLFTYRLIDVYNTFKESGCDTIVAKTIDDTELLKSFAVARTDSDGFLTELIEKPQNPASNLAVFATYFYKKETLPLFDRYLSEGNKPDAPGYFVQWLYKVNKVKTHIMDGDCYDVGTIAAYEHVNRKFKRD